METRALGTGGHMRTPILPAGVIKAKGSSLYELLVSIVKLTSSGERRVVSLVLMQRRSLYASVEPKAQHEPQELWSRMWPMVAAHWGKPVRESKSDGIASTASVVALRGSS